MAIVRKTAAELKANRLKLTAEQEARLAAMTEEDIEAGARSDPDNPPLTDDELARMSAARLVRSARQRAEASQSEFAERFNINLARLRDWERGRYLPDSVALSYMKVIMADPKSVERALKKDKAA